jgi:dihydroorotase-like cyclic amidohydrolase
METASRWSLGCGIVSKSRNTPFLNWELQGRIVEVRKAGKVVFGG